MIIMIRLCFTIRNKKDKFVFLCEKREEIVLVFSDTNTITISTFSLSLKLFIVYVYVCCEYFD